MLGKEFLLTTRRLIVALPTAVLLAYAVSVIVQSAGALAQTADEQQQLFRRMFANPADHEVTFAFVRVAAERGDYEAAVGALERLLFDNPNLSVVKYELGTLYFRLGSYEMARRYFRDALASPDLDAVTKSRIEVYLPQADKQLQQSRLSGFVQTGIRSQTNANYAPTGNLLDVGGTPLSLLPTSPRRSDINWFGLAGISHDYDLQNQRGDTLETRFAGYMTEQSRLPSLNVGFLDLSFGPRLAFFPDMLPGWTIKPYVVGGDLLLGGAQYLFSGGSGISLRAPINNVFTISPNFEWRYNEFQLGKLAPVSTFNTGNTYTGGLWASLNVTQRLTLDARAGFRRGSAAAGYQSYDQWQAEAAVTLEFTPPIDVIPRNWSVAPFVRYNQTNFDVPNPFIAPGITRSDQQWSVGTVFNAPITGMFGVSAAVEYDATGSTLPNYRLNNFSVMAGPTARF